jgi:hypothetical protein
MRTIKTYSKRAPFYNALIVRVDYFRVARNPPKIVPTAACLDSRCKIGLRELLPRGNRGGT